MTAQEFFASLFQPITPRKRGRRASQPVHSESLESRSLLTSLIGAEVTVSGTFQSNSVTAGQEVSSAAAERVVVEQSAQNDPELMQFGNLFDIDIDGNEIALNYNLHANFGSNPEGIINAGTFYRYYLKVEGLASDTFLDSVVADTTRNIIPTVSLSDPETILIEIGSGQTLGNGQNARIVVGLAETPRSIDGAAISIQNTFQSPLGTSGVEVPQGDPNASSVPENGAVFAQIGKSYDIAVTSSQIAMNFNSNGDTQLAGTVPADTWDRYYFNYTLKPNEFIASATARTSLTLVPNVTIPDADTVIVEIAPGMQVGDGFNALIDLEFSINGAEVSGRKWNDLNNDGVRTANEAWLNGWEIQLLDPLGNLVDTTFTRNIDLNNDGLIAGSEKGVYQFSGVQDGTYAVEEVLQQSWIQSSPVSPIEALAWQLNRDLQLQSTANDFLNWGGLNEKWVFGTGQWYYITPNGTFHQWNGSPRNALTGNAIAQLNADVYNNPAQLYDAPEPIRNVAVVESQNSVSGLNFGNYLAPPAFTVAADAPTNNVTFTWNSAAPGAVYEIWITDINTGRRHQVATNLTGTTYTTSLPDRQYRVWMRTEYSPDVYSSWSASQQFEFLRNPIDPIVAGLDAGIDGTPTVQWTAQTGARDYDIRVTDLAGNVQYLARNVVGTQHRVATELSLGTHRIAVRGNYTDGSRNEWSNGQLLTIDGRPVIQLNGRTLSWNAVAAANEYEVWVDRVDDQGNRLQRQVVYANDIKTLNYQLPALQRGRYNVWVRAIRAEGGDEHYSYWSAPIDFLVNTDAPTDEFQLVARALDLRTAHVNDQDPQAVTPPDDSSELPVQFPETVADEIDALQAVMEELVASDLLDQSAISS